MTGGTDGKADGTGNEAGVDSGALIDASSDGAPSATQPFSFTVFGDTQLYEFQAYNEARGLPLVVLDRQPDLILLTGDIAARGHVPGSYENFEDVYAPLRDAVPIFPAGGNHDFRSGAATHYRDYLERQLLHNELLVGAGYQDLFNLSYGDDPRTFSEDPDAPGPTVAVPDGFSWKTYYSFRHQNVYFVSMEVPEHGWRSTPVDWLRDRLEDAAALRSQGVVDHIVVFLHNPVWWSLPMTFGGYNVHQVREAYGSMFEEFDVSFVFAGHAHMYDHLYVPHPDASGQRAATRPDTLTVQWPQKADDPTPVFPLAQGVHYITTGGGGGGNLTHTPGQSVGNPNYCPAESSSYEGYGFVQKRWCRRHFVHVRVDGESIEVEATEVQPLAVTPNTWLIEQFNIEP